VFTPQGLSTLLNLQADDITTRPVTLGDVFSDNIGDTLLNARKQRERLARYTIRARTSQSRIARRPAGRRKPSVDSSGDSIDTRSAAAEVPEDSSQEVGARRETTRGRQLSG
jgi:hypothetical protein